jgi:hypothetical protein
MKFLCIIDILFNAKKNLKYKNKFKLYTRKSISIERGGIRTPDTVVRSHVL